MLRNNSTTKPFNPLLSSSINNIRSYHATKSNEKKPTPEELNEKLNEYLKRHKNKLGEVIEPDEDGLITVNNDGKFTNEEIRKMIDEEDERLTREEEEKELRKRKGGGKHGFPRKPLTFAHDMRDYEREELENKGEVNWWKIGGKHKRCGALGVKVGMVPVWDDWGERHNCTVLHLDNNVVLGQKTKEKHGYTSIQLGAGEKKVKRTKKPQLKELEKLGLGFEEHPPFVVREFRVTHPQGMDIPVGTQIHANHFLVGQNVDIAGISKGKGFQGGMKRHNFKGMPASHGVSKSHRSIGSTGSCQDPGRVFKGKKMPGRMGCDRVTVQNLRIVKIDRGRNLIFVRGPIPGNKGTFVEIKDAVKKPLFGTKMVPESVELPPLPTSFGEDGIDGSGKEGYEMMMSISETDPFTYDVEEE